MIVYEVGNYKTEGEPESQFFKTAFHIQQHRSKSELYCKLRDKLRSVTAPLLIINRWKLQWWASPIVGEE